MKVVVHRNRDTRQVIDTDSKQRQLFDSNNPSYYRLYPAHLATSERNRYNAFQESSWNPNRNFERTQTGKIKRHQKNKGRHEKYRARMQVKRDLAITSEKFTRLSVSTPTTKPQDEHKKSAESNSQIRLREPVLQFSRSYEEATSSKTISAATSSTSTPTAKTDSSSEELIEAFKCNMCPEFAVPEVHECSSGHTVCKECWLLSDGHCTLCSDLGSDKSTYRRVRGMERIASLLIFPCRWHHRGCLESLGPADWSNHVGSCYYAEELNPRASASQVSCSVDSDYEIDVDEVVDLPED